MRAFKFRMQSLLRLREQAREDAQRRLADALRRLAQCDQVVNQIRDELRGLEKHMRDAVKQQPLDVDRLLDGRRHQMTLQARLAELNKALSEAGEEVQRCRRNLVEADREVKVLEKLHERRLAEHQRQAAREEIKQLDEAAVIRAARQAAP